VTRRLLLSYLTITVIVLVLLELPLAIFYQQREADRLTAKVERDATVMATIYEDILQENLAPDPIPAAHYAQETGARVVVVDIDGISIVDSAREADRDFSTRPEIDKALTGVRATGIRRSDTLDTELLYVAVPVASGGTVHGAVRITFGTHEMNERVQRFWLGLIAVAAVVLVVTAAVGWVLARSVTKPVRRLQVAAQRFSRGDLTPIDTGSNSAPELAALETGLNDMAQQLDDLIERQRTFVADASHQLRTPLTALRLRLENLHSEAPTASLSNELDKAIDETTRLSTLVNDLLQLARTEQYRERCAVDLSQIVGDRVDIWTATADQSDVRLELHAGAGPHWALAIDGGIEQVLDNLIDNALRATPDGTTVTITLSNTTLSDTTLSSQPTHTIAIADEGPGLTDDDKARALKRFWRSDASTDGTGLGLAIAQAIVNSSGGEFRLTDNTPTGLIASIELGVAPQPPGPAVQRSSA
jgi:signal transduction histidine kinase